MNISRENEEFSRQCLTNNQPRPGGSSSSKLVATSPEGGGSNERADWQRRAL